MLGCSFVAGLIFRQRRRAQFRARGQAQKHNDPQAGRHGVGKAKKLLRLARAASRKKQAQGKAENVISAILYGLCWFPALRAGQEEELDHVEIANPA